MSITHSNDLQTHDAHRPTSMNFDDDEAFAEGEDPATSFTFAASTIRAELAKSLANGATDADKLKLNVVTRDDSVGDTDASVSTIDINGSTAYPPSPSVTSRSSSYQSHDSSANPDPNSSDFSQISLSDSPRTDEPEPYPSVHIQISQDDVPRVEEIYVQAGSDAYPPTSPSPSTNPSHSGSLYTSSLPPSAASGSYDTTPIKATSTPASLPQSNEPKRAGTSRFKPIHSAGPSVLDKVYSRTRPPFLPPKSRDEDNKHLADWESMMKQSRAMESKKWKAKNERKLIRERQMEESIQIWEECIVPDWKVVNKNPTMRKLWWQGIPTKLRGTMWEKAVGNALALSKDSYRVCLARARRSLAAGNFPTTTLSLMDQDIRGTLPTLNLFHPETGVMYQDLKDMLCAWFVSRSDEGLGYPMGVSKIAAMFLLNMSASEGFITMRNLLERHCMRSFYGGMGSKDDQEAYCRIFDTLLADAMPKIYFNFKQHQVSPAAYIMDWIQPLFIDHLDITCCAHIWDVLMLEGDSFLYRTMLAILAVLEPRLFFPDREELIQLLKGENKAALEVAKREQIPLTGPKYDMYGVDEEQLWEKIESLEEWWKSSTWTRLITRELPDL